MSSLANQPSPDSDALRQTASDLLGKPVEKLVPTRGGGNNRLFRAERPAAVGVLVPADRSSADRGGDEIEVEVAIDVRDVEPRGEVERARDGLCEREGARGPGEGFGRGGKRQARQALSAAPTTCAARYPHLGQGRVDQTNRPCQT